MALELPETQDPKPAPQEPKPAAAAPQAQKDQLAKQLTDTLQTMTAPPPPPAIESDEPPPNWEVNLQRLLSSKAAELMVGVYDDRGRILREPVLDEQEARIRALEYLPTYLEYEGGEQALKTYLRGGATPPGFLTREFLEKMGDPRRTTTSQQDAPGDQPVPERVAKVQAQGGLIWPSQETVTAQAKAAKFRAESPKTAAVVDYVLDPLGNIVTGAAQVGTDVVRGGLNLMGAEIPPLDAKRTLAKVIGNESTADQFLAMEASASGAAQVMRGAGEMVGMGIGFMPAGAVGTVRRYASPGLPLLGGAKVGEGIGKLLGGSKFGAEGAKIGHGAGVFATYEAIKTDGGAEDRAAAAGKGAIAGAALGVAQTAVSWGLRGMFKAPINTLAPNEQAVMQRLTEWARQQKVLREVGEPQPAYERRLIDTFIEAGLPGVEQAVPLRRLAAFAMKSGADGVGFTLLDPEVLSDVFSGKFTAKDAQKLAANTLGAMFLRVGGLRGIVPMQRKGVVEPTGKEPAVVAEPTYDRPAGPEAEAPREAILRKLREDIEQRSANPPQKPFEPTGVRLPEGPFEPKSPLEGTSERALRDVFWQNKVVLEELRQTLGPHGWVAKEPPAAPPEPAAPPAAAPAGRKGKGGSKGKAPKKEAPAAPQASGTEVTLDGTKLGYRIDGDTVRPNEALRKLLGLPEEMPRGELEPLLVTQALGNALDGKLLPGMEVSVGQGVVKGTAGAEPKFRRVTPEGVQEAKPALDPKWGPAAEAVQKRPPEAVEPEQADAVKVLQGVQHARADLPPAEQALLAKSIGVLDTVAARSDQSVKETLAALPELVAPIAQGSPQEAAAGVKALAEALTIKTPERALKEMQALKAERTDLTRQLAAAVQQFGETSPQAEAVRQGIRELNREALALKDMQKRATDYFSDEAIEMATAETKRNPDWRSRTIEVWPIERFLSATERYQGSGVDQRKAEEVAAVLGRGEKFDALPTVTYAGETIQGTDGFHRALAVRANGGKTIPVLVTRLPAEPSPESGAVINPAVVAANVADAVTVGGSGIGQAARKAWEWVTRSYVKRVADLGEQDIANDILLPAQTQQKSLIRERLGPAGLYDLHRHKRSDGITTLGQDLVVDPANPNAAAARGAIIADAGLQRHWPRQEAMSDGERRVLELMDGVRHEAGRIAEETGVVMDTGRKFTHDEGRKVFVRIQTQEGSDATRMRSGPLWEARMRWLQQEYGWERQEAERKASFDLRLDRTDATEIARKIPYEPTHYRINGRWVPYFETDPVRYADRLAFTNSHVMASLSVMPREAMTAEAKETRDIQETELPAAARALLDGVASRNPKAVDETRRAIRLAFGLVPDARTPWFQPGSAAYHLERIVRGVVGLDRAMKLTRAHESNVFEPITNASLVGGAAQVAASARNVATMGLQGRLPAEHRRAVTEGWIADSKDNAMVIGENPLATFENALQKAGELLTTPLRLSQAGNELVLVDAARTRLEAMREGNGDTGDLSLLRNIGIPDARARAMIRGEGTPQDYAHYVKNAVSALAGGRSAHGLEKTHAAFAPGYNALVWFTNLFQFRSRMMDQLVRQAATAPAGERAAMYGELAKYAGFTVAGGAMMKMLQELISRGWTGPEDYWRESTQGEDAVDSALNIGGAALKLLVRGTGGGIFQPTARAVEQIGEGGTGEDLVREVAGSLGSVGFAAGQYDFWAAMAGQDIPGYENKSALGKVATYVRREMPAAKLVHEGVFGLQWAALAEDNPKLDAALDSFRRFERFSGAAQRDEDTRAFRDAMKKVISGLKAGQDWSDQDLIDALVDAQDVWMQEKAATDKPKDATRREAREAVAASLLQRRVLPQAGERAWPKEKREALFRHLGEQHQQELADFDLMLEQMSKRVRRTTLRKN